MPNIPETKEDILWIKHECEVCGAVTGYLSGDEPHCSRCSINSAVNEQATEHSESTKEKIEEKYCLCDHLNTDDPETLKTMQNECAALGCNVCLSKTEEDVIEWPKHYNASKIQPIDAIESWDLDFRLANVIKYVARAGKKDPNKKKEDLLKAKWYLERFLKKEFT